MTAGKCVRGRGFTLIELLVTIAVIIILATIAVPNFQGFISTNRLAAEYNQILTGLHYARSVAVKEREVVRAEVTNGSGSWEMDVVLGAHVLRSFSSSNGSIVVSDGAVEFNALGRRVPDSCTFESCKVAVGDKEIEINAAGNIARPQL